MEYRKKPIVIDAKKYEEGMEDGLEVVKVSDLREDNIRVAHAWYGDVINDKSAGISLPYINTLEGKHYIYPDDMIITGVKGERYPCKADIFDMTYEEVKPIPETDYIKQMCKPIASYIEEYANPHTQIIITDKEIRVVEDKLGIPVKC